MSGPAPTTRAAAGMGAIAAVSRAFGFVRVLVIAAVLGTTYLGNAFQAANTVSNVLFELLAAGALSAVLVPTFVDLLDAGDRKGAEEVAGGVLGIALAVLGTVSLIGILAAPLLARALTVGVPAHLAPEQRELTTYLLRFFVPQVVLYAAGTVATAVLYARRRFAITAAAPIGNTVVMVACLVAFRAVAGADPALALTAGERWLLVAAGTGGVLAFVGLLVAACERAELRLRPRWPRRDPRVGRVLRHSGWGVVLHSAGGALLAAAIVAGSAVEGGVVAYQVGWVFFLAPYAIFAQPIHTAILPELVAEARDAELARFRASVRWSVERMALFVVPVSAGMLALALPGMRAVAFGAATGDGPGLMAAALAGLAVGLLPYGAFLLLARAYYALGDSRTPGVVSLGVAAAGIAVMAIGASLTDGAARIAVLGAGHSVAYLLGSLVLGARLSQRAGGSVWPAGVLPVVAVSALVGGAGWLLGRAVGPADPNRLADLALVAAVSLPGAGLILGAVRALRLTERLTARRPMPPADVALADPSAPEAVA